MNSLFSNCFDYLKSDDAQRQIKKSVIAPIGQIIYQDFYFYVWLICFYHIFLIILVLIAVLMLFKQHSLLHSYFLLLRDNSLG